MSFAAVAALVVLAMSLIVGGDAAGKLLTQAGFSPFFVAWTRFALAAALLAPVCGLRRAELPALLNWRILLRAGLIIGGICCILSALRTTPIADAFGAFFVGPIVSYALSALLLREPVSWLRTALLLVGFAGVLLVVKPGFGVSSGMALALLAGCFHGSYLVATRWIAGSYRPRFLLFSQLLVGAVVLAPFGLAPIMPALDAHLVLLVVISALGSAGGNFILVMVNRAAPASVIAPLIYSQLLAATVLGYLVFGDWPDPLSFLGLSIIILSGLASLYAARGAR